MEKVQDVMQKTKTTLRPFYRLIVGLPFWVMALFCFFLRLLVKQPFGPLLALITGCVWVYNNMDFVKVLFFAKKEENGEKTERYKWDKVK